ALRSAVEALVLGSDLGARVLMSDLRQFEAGHLSVGGRTFRELSAAASAYMEEVEALASVSDSAKKDFALVRGGQNQFLLPVRIGNQVFRLLVDTGSNALLVFDALVNDNNSGIVRSGTTVKKKYSSVVRTGLLATAEVQIGGYSAKSMRIMLISDPLPSADPSLTAKRADGIIGLRRTDGLAISLDDVPLDVPLAALEPAVSIFELDLPPTGEARLSFGTMPVLNAADPAFVFRSKTYSVADKADSVNRSYSDLQVPFRARSSAGETSSGELDILLDTGAVTSLTLDVRVAEMLGYSASQKRWLIPADEEIDFNIVGPKSTLGLLPKFKVSEIAVAQYSSTGVNFEAVLGITSWQNYVVGFYFVDMQSGGPDGTISFLERQDMESIVEDPVLAGEEAGQRFVPLPGLNSNGDDGFASMDEDGDTIVFQSNRNTGRGHLDVYAYRIGTGLLQLPNLNSEVDDSDPSVSGDGRFMVFHSNRAGGFGDYDIYLYDLVTGQFLNLPGLNSSRRERNPVISPDGRYIAFRSERDPGGSDSSSIFVYDRQQQALLPTPQLRSRADWDYDPSISRDGRFIAFDNYDIYLYDLLADSFVTLPTGINTANNELAAAISPDGLLVAYASTGHDISMGLFNQDIYFWDRVGSVQTFIQALNTDFNEIAPQFSGDGAYLALHSNRPGGAGATDVYVYRLKSTGVPNVQSTLLSPDLALTASGPGYTVQATVNGVSRTLLLDTSLNALVMYYDRPGQSRAGAAASLLTAGGTCAGNLFSAKLEVGGLCAQSLGGMLISSSDAGTLWMDSLSGIDGVLGLHFRRTAAQGGPEELDVPLMALEPRVNMMEFNFNPYGASSLSLGRRPNTAAANPEYLFNSHIEGYEDEEDPQAQSCTDLVVPFVASFAGNVAGLGGDKRMLLGSALKELLVLDDDLAVSIGYSTSSNQWEVEGRLSQMLDLYIKGIGSHLRVPSSYPYSQIAVRDLGAFEYDAILSVDRWQDYITGFDITPWEAGGPDGVIAMLHRSDLNRGRSHA
ncbi:MAG: PD40 domain-containing protein, partial [Planctomycetes bacterium]|nr:PD40 domain-containing protein [Planctomycetota bacterium]